MRTAIVILNWNTKEYLKRFLPGVIAYSAGADVIVADNASNDGSIELLDRDFPEIRKIRFDRNYGFTGGYNKAFEAIKDEGYEYYLLLNTDIEVPDGWLSPLVEFMDSHPECGACSPKLHAFQDRDRFEYAGAAGGFIDKFGFPFCRGRVMNMVERDYGQYDNGAKQLFWATGACLMVRSILFHECGGLDNRFFAHMEEIDFCWRLQLAGHKIYVVPDSVVWHLGGGTLPVSSPWKLQLNYRNNLLMLQNNLSRSYALEMYRNGRSIKKAARSGRIKARVVIAVRMLIDGCTAIVYLLTGKLAYFKSVFLAHNEYRQLGNIVHQEDIEKYLSFYGDKAEIVGWYRKSIVARAVILKKGIWKTIHKL